MDGIQGISEQEGRVMDEVRFQLVGGEKGLIALAQRALNAEAVGYVGKRHERCPVGQGSCRNRRG